MHMRAAAIASAAVAAIVGGAILVAATPAVGGTGDQVDQLNAAAGKTTFINRCAGCHPAAGAQAGIGPKLKGRGLARALIDTQTRGGGGGMPGFGTSLSSAELANVVDYTVSIQRTAPAVRALRPTTKMKKALKNAHIRRLKAKKISRARLKGPLKGNKRKPITQVKWARYGKVEWAIGTFTRAKVGKKGQPEIFRRVIGKRWVDLGPSKTCFKKIPASARKAMKLPRGRC